MVLLTRVDFRSEPEKGGARFALQPAGGHSLRLAHTASSLSLMALDMFAVLLGGAVYLLPIYAEEILRVGPQASDGFAPHRASAPSAWRSSWPTCRRCGARDEISCSPSPDSARATIVFGLSQSFWLSLAMLFLTGAFDNVSMVVRHTLVQLLTTNRMRGRVLAVNYVFIGASNELGGMESGLVAHWFGPVVSVVSGGIGTLLVVIGTATGVPGLRRFGALHEARPEEEETREKRGT